MKCNHTTNFISPFQINEDSKREANKKYKQKNKEKHQTEEPSGKVGLFRLAKLLFLCGDC